MTYNTKNTCARQLKRQRSDCVQSVLNFKIYFNLAKFIILVLYLERLRIVSQVNLYFLVFRQCNHIDFDRYFLTEVMSAIYPDDFNYTYYDYSFRFRNDDLISTTSSWRSFARIILVILLRIGFVLIHIGSVPVNNVNLILLQNIIDFCWVTIVYALVGIVIAYTGDIKGLLGEGHWIGDEIVDKDEIIIGWSAVSIAAAILTCGIVGRTHTIGYLIIGFLLAGLVQPFLIHWIWTPQGWIRTNVLLQQEVYFHDYGGSAVVHLVGGLSGFIGCLTLGRRILRLDAIDDASIAVGSAGTVFAGQLFVFIGLQVTLLRYKFFKIYFETCMKMIRIITYIIF